LSARRQSRLIAAQALYAYDMGNRQANIVDNLLAQSKIAQKYKDFATRLFETTRDNLIAIDETLAANISKDWSLERLGRAELAILRLACCEIAYLGEDAPVAISEALELAKQLADDNAPPFINGILEAVRKQRSGA
jgi:N utilization substance protein B